MAARYAVQHTYLYKLIPVLDGIQRPGISRKREAERYDEG